MAIAAGKAACTKARPTSAGLKTLKPMPPKRALPSAMAETPATTPIHSGNPGGRVSASSRPVMVAEKSDRLPAWVPVRTKARSARRQEAVTTRIEANAERPYWYTKKVQTGSSEYTTFAMICSTLRGPLMCGALRISVWTVTPPPSPAGSAWRRGTAAPAGCWTDRSRCSSRTRSSRRGGTARPSCHIRAARRASPASMD